MNNFITDLSASFIEGIKPFWCKIYNEYFPNMISESRHDNDPELQKHGIDRIIFLNNGRKVSIDEKVRYVDFGDIILEESSSQYKPGWIEKDDLWIDFIFYVVLPSNKCYILPFGATQNAWRKHKEQWKKIYKPVRAINNGYTTLSWAIPPNVLYSAITGSYIVNY